MKSPISNLPANTLPMEVRNAVTELLQTRYGSETLIKEFTLIAGGCINHGGELVTTAGSFFVKWNDAHHFPGMFSAEAKGLSLLAKGSTLRIPEVIGVGATDEYQFIIIEFIASGKNAENFWRELGHKVALLHQYPAKKFGHDEDNYIGSLDQQNTQTDSWIDFFINQRIEKQLMMAEKTGLVDFTLRKKFETLFTKLPQILLEGKPVLIHGDLWSGNLVTDQNGGPCLIDPAVYFGNFEIELAYTKLFGGFDPEFYNAYEDVNPLPSGFEERKDIYNLYPFLVHTNLFGRRYLEPIEDILKKFI